MENEDIKNVFGSIFDGLINTQEQETKKEFEDEIKKLIDSKHNLKNMEHYDVFINYPLNNALKAVVAGLNEEVTDRNKLSKLYFIYKHYNYLDRNLAKLIETKEGSSCSVDKSRWLIKAYREFILDGIIPNMEREEKCYWKPKFGTGEQWMFLCSGLMDLYYGNPREYLLSYMSLGC